MEMLLISAAGSLIGAIIAQVGEGQARAIIEKARLKYGELNPETIEAMAAETLGPSAMGQVKADQRLKDAQYSALEKMKGIEDGGGFDASDRANLNRVNNDAARADQANRGSIVEGMSARGMGGSGAELAMQMGSAQQSADRQHQGGLDAAGQARQRYFQSIMARGQLAGNMRDQGFREDSQAAKAKDEVARLNWGRRFAVQDRNNDARQQNFVNQRSLVDGETGFAREEANDTRRNYNRVGAEVGVAGNTIGNAASQYGDDDDYEDENGNRFTRGDY